MDPETWPAGMQLTLYLAERKELLTSNEVKCVTISDQYRLLQRCEGWQRAFESERVLECWAQSVQDLMQRVYFGIPVKAV
jgi:hypothetical protein